MNDLDHLIAVLQRSPIDLKLVGAIGQRNPELEGILSKFSGRSLPLPMLLVCVGVGTCLKFLTRLRLEASLYLGNSERFVP